MECCSIPLSSPCMLARVAPQPTSRPHELFMCFKVHARLMSASGTKITWQWSHTLAHHSTSFATPRCLQSLTEAVWASGLCPVARLVQWWGHCNEIVAEA
eukprot:6480498-Amphidinium_carterae.2